MDLRQLLGIRDIGHQSGAYALQRAIMANGSIPVLLGYDATSENEHLLPATEMAAGYDTQVGTNPPIKWTAEQFDRHSLPYPAIHIDQDPLAVDTTADVLDVEAGAASDAEVVRWITQARNSWGATLRLGQRWPAIYCSENNVPGIVTILTQAGLTAVPFWVANYSVSETEAVRRVAAALGPYPAIGYQYTDQAFGGNADADVWSQPWVTNVARPHMEDDDMYGQLVSRASVPFPAGAFTRLFLYRDFTAAANNVTVRVAVSSQSKGYSQIEDFAITDSQPFVVDFTEKDVDGVSLVLNEPALGPVGYSFA